LFVVHNVRHVRAKRAVLHGTIIDARVWVR
jgi:hypothetical protein